MKTKIILIIASILITISYISAQHDYYDHGDYNPDSLETVTLNGTVIVDTLSFHHQYFLDVDDNGIQDYYLNFGPYWYVPDSSNAVRPSDGEEITIVGGLHQEMNAAVQVVVVYEINGEYWREPYEPMWNNFSGHGMHSGDGHQGDCYSYGYDWHTDSVSTVEKSGTVLVDSTFYYSHYYLDENNDSIPEYFLNFGPPWYEPESGSLRPEAGEEITVKGGLSERMNFDMLIVYELNGESWRDSSLFGNHYGGGWMHSSDNDTVKFHSPYDNGDYLVVHPGWKTGGMHGGMMMPDSIFVQMLELFPGSLPGTSGQNAFAGYQINMIFPGGRGMGQGGSCGGMMQFNSNIDFNFHYDQLQLDQNGIDESEVLVKVYDESAGTWTPLQAVNVNTEENIVSFSSSNVNNFIMLSGQQEVTGTKTRDNIPEGFILKQNYPNPFNPSTTIEFNLKEDSKVTLSVFNILGQEVAVLLNGQMPAGTHKIRFNANDLSTGIYIYRLKAGNFIDMKKMQLLK